MKKLIVAVIATLSTTYLLAVPVRIKTTQKGNAKVQFAISFVDNIPTFTVGEQNDLQADRIARGFPGVVVSTGPSQFETNLSTCVLSDFVTVQDWEDAKTQAGIMIYLDELYVRIQTLLGSAQNAKAAKTQANYDYLSSQAKTLP